ncbi:MAG: DUF1311 domain-containing protein [Burkholderiales bacterium]|nr:DUF1311 domain-containing protein [Burkholderiales bacterium]
MRALLCLVAVWFAASTPAYAASFDCTKARSATERMICTDQKLSSLDEDLARHYARALERVEDTAELKRMQRNWLATQRRECLDANCLVSAYQNRITELQSDVRDTENVPPAASTPLTATEINACRAVVAASNRGKLADLEDKSTWRKAEEAEFDRIFGESWPMASPLEYLMIDLDDDGKPDYFSMSSAWPSLTNFSIGRLSRPGFNTRELNDEHNENQRLLQIAQRHYILTENFVRGYGTQRHLSYLGSLFKWRANGKLEKLCDYSTLEPKVVGRPLSLHPVCDAVEHGNFREVSFTEEHSIGDLTDLGYDSYLKMVPGLARVDLDNDGIIDNVVRVNKFIVEYGGCDTNYLAMANAKATALRQKPGDQLFIQGKNWCDPNATLIAHDGKIYIDAKMPMSDRTIYRVNGSNVTPLCTFKYDFVHTMILAN